MENLELDTEQLLILFNSLKKIINDCKPNLKWEKPSQDGIIVIQEWDNVINQEKLLEYGLKESNIFHLHRILIQISYKIK